MRLLCSEIKSFFEMGNLVMLYSKNRNPPYLLPGLQNITVTTKKNNFKELLQFGIVGLLNETFIELNLRERC